MTLSAIQSAPEPATPKRISILGSTGSIGQSTIDILQQDFERYQIQALTAYDNVELLIEQAKELNPSHVVIGNEAHYQTLKNALSGLNIEVSAGDSAICDAASIPADWTMAAIVGSAGLRPTLKAIEQGNSIAFASKECLVCAGELMMQACTQSGATLLPVDSEHNAIFQVFDFEQADQVDYITLTASGGPFRTTSIEQLATITPEQAVAHPNWDMGAKISVDSATMMNKGLELIEAYHLFPVSADQIEIIVHPESVIHSMVSYKDGSVLAQLGMPDMRIPIAYTLAWPERIDVKTPKLSLTEIGALNFEEPDNDKFPSLNLAKSALQTGGSAPTILNAANEVAVSRFLNNEIGFMDIIRIVEQCLNQIPTSQIASLEDVLACDTTTRMAANIL